MHLAVGDASGCACMHLAVGDASGCACMHVAVGVGVLEGVESLFELIGGG